jgi:CRP-like cAMP-binding protein
MVAAPFSEAIAASGARSAASRTFSSQADILNRCHGLLFEAAHARLGRASENVMGVFMYEFMSDQVLGINGLINLSNIVFLVAFSVRDFLKLRILAIVGEGLTLPYYYFQGEPLWPPIVWGAAFMFVNAVRVIAIALERRPVVLSDREERLYRVAFSSIDKREFVKLVSLAQWVKCSPGELILKKGQHISEAIVVMAGDLEAILGGNSRMALRPGQLIGDVSAYSGLASPADVVARGPGILAKWDLRHVREFTASRPELRANLLRIVSVDLAAKLRDIVNPSLGADELVPKLSPGGT